MPPETYSVKLLLYYAHPGHLITTRLFLFGGILGVFYFINPYFHVTYAMENIFEEQVKSELKSMDQRLYDMEEKIGSIDTKLTQVVDAILGNRLTKTGGFVKDIQSLEEKIKTLEGKVEKHEDFKKKVYWAAAILGALVVGDEYIVKIINNLN